LHRGFKYKIAKALKNINFEGELYVIEPNKKAIEFLREKYMEILPNTKIYFLSNTLEDSIEYLPKRVDLLCANHCLDDMIITEYLKNNINIFNDKNVKEVLTEKWNKLSEDKARLNQINIKVLENWKKLFRTIKIKKVILAQYRSTNFFSENTTLIYNLTKKLFDNVKKLISIDNDLQEILYNIKLSKNYKYINLDEKELYSNILNYENWILGGCNNE